ncbi:hypothetical protein GCM10029963_60640 [Micromonospora andamanensis]
MTNGGAVINLVIVTEAGHPVPQVTTAVRVEVTRAVEAYGLRVDEINIRVDDVAIDGPSA